MRHEHFHKCTQCGRVWACEEYKLSHSTRYHRLCGGNVCREEIQNRRDEDAQALEERSVDKRQISMFPEEEK